MEIQLLGTGSQEAIEKQIRIVAAAGRLSRFKGNVFEVYDKSDDFEKNVKFIKRVLNMDHESISEHDYIVFGIRDVSPIIEQLLIEQRFASFTIKSRREVDFSDAGYYIPEFHELDGSIHSANDELKRYYKNNMDDLFDNYSDFIEKGIDKEDARYILPYCFYSNIIMGINAHTFKDLIINFTKGKNSNISEVKEFGDKLYSIMLKRAPYLIEKIDNSSVVNYDLVEETLLNYIDHSSSQQTIDKTILLSSSLNADDNIFISSIMRIYGVSFEKASELYQDIIQDNDELKKKLMRDIWKQGGQELKQVNFQFQIPISLAALTHLTRHRTHDILIPDFVPIRNLKSYKTPNSIIESGYEDMFDGIFKNNYDTFQYFSKMGVRPEDLIYFYLSGNMLNVVSNMDGETLRHFCQLRCCNKAQWEIRDIANDMRKLASENNEYLSSILGPTCETEGICYEGKECCGKVKQLKTKN